jgi:hypothetical protein
MLTIHADIHAAVMALPPDERRDRAKVNEAVRERIRLDRCGPLGVRTYMAFRKRRNRTDQVFGAGTFSSQAGSRICMGPPVHIGSNQT